MRRLLLIAALVIVSPGLRQTAAWAQEVNAEEAKKEVLKIENEMNQAIVQKDATALARIYADDLVYINGAGEVLNKSQALADYRSGNNTLVHLDHDDIQLHFHGNTIVLTGRSNSTVRYKGKDATIPRRFISVFRLIDGRWQIISHQVTDVEQHPNAHTQ